MEIENEETCNEEEQKYKATIEDGQSMVHEETIEDEAIIVCEETIKDEPPIIWDIPTPTLSGRNSEYEDEGDQTEYGPLDLTMKPRKTSRNTTYSTSNRKKKNGI